MALSIQIEKPLAEAACLLQGELPRQNIAIKEEVPVQYGLKLCCEKGDQAFNIVLYASSKRVGTRVVIEGKAGDLTNQVEKLLSQIAAGANRGQAPQTINVQRPVKQIPTFSCHIGTDESGKGDYFGPLVVAGVYVDKNLEEILATLGVADSKKNTDKRNSQLAAEIKQVLQPHQYDIVTISPYKYNQLYEKTGRNLNNLLAWAHARVIENLLQKNPCQNIVVDQFGSEAQLKRRLMELARGTELFVTPQGERDVAVAAASILARSQYLNSLQALSREAGVALEKGASVAVGRGAKLLVKQQGAEKLGYFAKLHFKTTEKVLSNEDV